MTPELKARLEACKNLPSPPGVATQIITLANDPEADMSKIAKALAMDPAITTKILRIANSPMYAQQRKTENLRQALVVLGLNATISLALSFSLLKSWQNDDCDGGLDYPLYWRRALLSATVSRVLANAAGLKDAEELFLTCLIQDIGMLALDRSVDGLYDGLAEEQGRQRSVIAREREKIEVDHAAVGGWLLERWHFPDRIQQGVAASHDAGRVPRSSPNATFVRCVVMSSLIAELFLDQTGERRFDALANSARKHLGLDKETLGEVLTEVTLLIPEVEGVFETQILGQASSDSILDEAREVLMLRNLAALQTVDNLQEQAESLESRTKELEESSRRDTLTGLYNRRHLDQFMEEAFAQSKKSKAPLSIAFADLDKFKSVNDTYGHQVGDQILTTTASILKASVRSTDIVARYGGEEFILVFPDTDYRLVKTICERIVQAFQKTRHDVGVKKDLLVTISVGMATHGDGRVFDSLDTFVKAADKALYTAKLQGRNRSVPYDTVAQLKVAQM